MTIRRAKQKMCENKATFHSKHTANRVAEQFDQTVYECPVCFCFHLTSKADWRLEFVDAQYHQRQILAAEQRGRSESKAKIKALNTRINELEREVSVLRKAMSKMSSCDVGQNVL